MMHIERLERNTNICFELWYKFNITNITFVKGEAYNSIKVIFPKFMEKNEAFRIVIWYFTIFHKKVSRSYKFMDMLKIPKLHLEKGFLFDFGGASAGYVSYDFDFSKNKLKPKKNCVRV